MALTVTKMCWIDVMFKWVGACGNLISVLNCAEVRNYGCAEIKERRAHVPADCMHVYLTRVS